MPWTRATRGLRTSKVQDAWDRIGSLVLHMATDWIQRAKAASLGIRNFVDGCWHPQQGGNLLNKLSSRDGQLLYQIGEGNTEDADTAVEAARRAFNDGRWSLLPIQERKESLHRLALLIERNREEFALLECLDVGKPISDALAFDVPMAAAIIRFSAEAADKLHGPVYGSDANSLSYQLRRPLGVVGGIVGWNFPLLLAAGKIGPALATGNSLVLKPSEFTALSTARVAELAVEAGIPVGTLNVVHGGRGVGAALAKHPDVELVTFTGSTRTGKELLVAAGMSNMKRLILECGGKAPSIVFDDIDDLDGVASAIVSRAFWNQGQVCTASSRLLVQRTIKDELMRCVMEKASALRLGDPLSPDTTLGAVMSREHRDRVLDYIRLGEKEGARIVYRSGSPPPHPNGFYIAPVILDQVTPEHRIANEEIFGPVLSVLAFSNEDEAVRIANGTVFGLSAIVWTGDLGRAQRLSQAIKAGWISINATGRPTGGPPPGVISVGGHKQSGFGLEGGLDGLAEYTTKTAVQIFV